MSTVSTYAWRFRISIGRSPCRSSPSGLLQPKVRYLRKYWRRDRHSIRLRRPHGFAFENLSAVALGTEDPIAYRRFPIYRVASGQCQEGLAEAQRQLRAIEGGDSPSARVS